MRVLFVIFLATQAVSAQSWVQSVMPAQNELSAAVDADVVVEFNQAMDESTVTADAFVITGSYGSTYAISSVNYDAPSNTATLSHSAGFWPGELVQVTVTTAVENSGGQAMPDPFVWHFTGDVPKVGVEFLATYEAPVASAPYAIASSDFDGNGALDIVTASRGANAVSILDGDGSGSFASFRTVAVGSTPEGIVSGDWNNDGAPDLATANAGGNSVTVLLNDGVGQFSSSTVVVGNGPHTIRTGDLNGDGKLDLVTSEFGSAALSILLGDGLGGFARTPLTGPGASPELVMIRDFDNDGDLDLVAPSFGSSTVRLFRNDGTASFTAEPTITVAGGLHGLCTGDLNGNQSVDVLAPSSSANQLYRLTNDGTGSFLAEPAAPVTSAWYCGVGDMDGDDDLDVVVTSYTPADLTLFANDGSGTFTLAQMVNTGTRPHGVVLADFDNNGTLELATANDGSASVTLIFRTAAPATEDGLPVQDHRFRLNLPHPNPSADTVELGFSLARPAFVRLEVFNLVGKSVATIVEGEYASGQFTTQLQTSDLPAGSYLVRMEVDGRSQTRRVTILR